MKKYRKMFASAAMVLTLAMLLSVTAFAYTGVATVATDDLNMREGASLDYNVIDCLPRGAKVIINFDAGYGWYQVTYNGQTGYMAGYYLLLGDLEEEEAKAAAAAAGQEYVPQTETLAPAQTAPQPAETVSAPVQTVTETYTAPNTGSGGGTIRGTDVRLRSGPSMNSETITYLGNGANVGVHGACGAWYEVEYNGSVGYVYGDYVVLSGQSVTYTMTAATTVDDTAIYTEPVTEETYVAGPALAETPAAPAVVQTSFSHNAAAGQAIIDTAKQFTGTPYRWGGTSPEEGFDCSGFVYYVYGLHGYTLNRVAQSMYYNGVDVDLGDLQPGDILLFGSSIYNIWHAGLYVGNGIFIHSPHSGQVVSTQALSDTYGMRLVAARRIV